MNDDQAADYLPVELERAAAGDISDVMELLAAIANKHYVMLSITISPYRSEGDGAE